eukprot:428280-Prymnesium_polylepis.1
MGSTLDLTERRVQSVIDARAYRAPRQLRAGCPHSSEHSTCNHAVVCITGVQGLSLMSSHRQEIMSA